MFVILVILCSCWSQLCSKLSKKSFSQRTTNEINQDKVPVHFPFSTLTTSFKSKLT